LHCCCCCYFVSTTLTNDILPRHLISAFKSKSSNHAKNTPGIWPLLLCNTFSPSQKAFSVSRRVISGSALKRRGFSRRSSSFFFFPCHLMFSTGSFIVVVCLCFRANCGYNLPHLYQKPAVISPLGVPSFQASKGLFGWSTVRASLTIFLFINSCWVHIMRPSNGSCMVTV